MQARRPLDPRGAIVPLAAVLLLEAGMRWFDVRSDSLALPSEVAKGLSDILLDGSLLKATWETLVCAGTGVLLAAVAGVLLGALLGLSRVLDGLAWLPVESLRHLPPVALMPIVILLLGLSASMEIVVIAFTCFWPMLLLTRAAVAGVEPRLLEVARVLRLGRVRTFRWIVLPAAAPRVVVAFRLAIGIALIVSITTEIAANPRGLGYLMVKSQQELQAARMFAGLLWLALLGWAVNKATLRAEAALLRAHSGVRA